MPTLHTWFRVHLDLQERDARETLAALGRAWLADPLGQASLRHADARARWDLADVAAKRRILDIHRPVPADDVPGLVQCAFDSEPMPCEHLRLLAQPYAPPRVDWFDWPEDT